MRREWPKSARAYAETVSDVLGSLGGVEAARRAEVEPTHRAETVRPRLDAIGALALDPWGDEEESAAAALAVREAGRVVLPWPLVHVLAVPPSARADCGGVHLVLGECTALDHADVLPDAIAVDLRDQRVFSVTVERRRQAPLDPFGCEVRLVDTGLGPPVTDASAMHLLLDAFWVGGALAGAADLALRHARERRQFGVPIGRFGEIRWRIADLVLARDSLDELARYTWWLLRVGRAGPADLLALRLQMLESARTVLANAHQILGAMGLCEEHDLAVIDRHLQPTLRRPVGRLGTTTLLADRIRRDGFDALFPVPPSPIRPGC
ncbi:MULTISPECIES: acyl-CoA dehydrogenase family protein [Streptacidiphilus]|uniref:Acyl-CoA dehydrogenase family protein n=1 Tax=Streptacidiphilus cavernicola TaxID=3342716 RepID=A0ABV6UMT5_9ACTN|nr:acyl-CoA dehydrogenase family protein [Streptacidiphilus jeojiense]